MTPHAPRKPSKQVWRRPGRAAGRRQTYPIALSKGQLWISPETIATCLWFERGQAREAAEFYAATFPNSHVGPHHASPSDYPAGKQGDELMVEFTVLGTPFLGLNGGPHAAFNDAVSFQVYTDSQEETDRYWNAIVSDGQESQCSWCKDKFGLSWQIVPRVLLDAIRDPDQAAAKRAMEAMMGMKKIDIAAIERACAGTQPVASNRGG
jgi:predicted 3-demethylubiquinone-9 3-methyltransferase (glyoxalase superfamily)